MNIPRSRPEPFVETAFQRISAGAPEVSRTQLREVLKESYGLTVAQISELGGEIDQNLLVEADDGTRYVVKVLSDAADFADVTWRVQLLRHLGESVTGVAVPRPLPTLNGDTLGVLRREGRLNYIQVLSWIPGTLLSSLSRRPPTLLREIGTTAATLVTALTHVAPPPVSGNHHWDLTRADEAVASCLDHVADPDRVALVTRVMTRYAALRERIQSLPKSVVHNDLNDFNILLGRDANGHCHVSAVVDVGDAMYTARIAELSVAVAYAMLGTRDPLRAATEVVRGYARTTDLDPGEIGVIFPLAAARVCVNATTWTRRASADETGDYGRARSRHSWDLLAMLSDIPSTLAEATFREAAGLDPWPRGVAVRTEVAATFGAQLIGITPSLEFAPGSTPVPNRADPQPATLELGMRIEPTDGTRITTPVGGLVDSADRQERTVTIRHGSGAATHWSVWRGIVPVVVAGTRIGDNSPIGEVVSDGRDEDTGGGSCRLTVLAEEDLVPGVPARVQPWLRKVWAALSPAPAQLAAGVVADDPAPAVDVREQYTGRAQRYYFDEPMTVVSSQGVWMSDTDGLAYLDAINNVTHIGHADATVADAVSRQVRRLNTNSRFVYAEFGRYAERLASLLPDPLAVVYFVCTGSEANDLALRMARQVTGRTNVMVVDGAYHGNTTAVLQISPDRYDAPGGGGRPDTTHVVAQPNRYRGPYGYEDPLAAQKYAADVDDVARRLSGEGRAPAALFTEALIGSGGQITLPPGYLASAFEAVRAVGGLCVSDEVQIGIGRLGTMWGFEAHGAVPDIVTLGKPLGNGMPLAAVATTREIADEFDRGIRYFNTFAGNPVCCAAGLAVLDVIERDGLVERAALTGAHLLSELRGLAERHALIGDVRGEGMYAGIELVRDRTTKEPAGAEALYVSQRMREEGVLIYPNGRFGNILKIKPPLIFDTSHVQILVDALDSILTEDW
ncbi:aminotransferase class III-fold pyridoxal phosphate-dependent enzyme [Dactylosporangium sp. NPDC051484]|uniref:aminotransferase class III-fold pyridoxal phosphate-dependent enzyme n=1 Tax=Dactylosporangium sp. NPDC051484 TaxID=3154942 RepID=UPI00344E164F